MSDTLILILVATVFGVLLIAIIGYRIMRSMRGSIKLSLPNITFNPGDQITGQFDLHTKKRIQGKKLTVSLIGKKITKTHTDERSRTHSHEIYRDEKVLEGAKEFPVGHRANYDFEIATPNPSTPDSLNSTLGQTLKTALNVLTQSRTRFQWKVEVRLDAKGIDLVASKPISLNISPLI